MSSSIQQLRFDKKVVVITGAGRGIGRQYALFFASRGAKIVVNDSGCDLKGNGVNEQYAEEVVQEIRSIGKNAIVNFDDVQNGDKIIEAAVKAYGTVDILINNAGFLKDVTFMKMNDQDFNSVVQNHLFGTYKTCRAAWNIMREKGYGRIINTSSGSGIYGSFGQANYSAAKSGIIGLTNTLAREGSKRNILVNTIIPVAASRMTETVMPVDFLEMIKPEYIVPLVAFLCHQSCEETGSVFELAGGYISKLRWQRSEGVMFDVPFTPENVAQKWQEITCFNRNNDYPTTSAETINKVNENFDRIQANKEKPKL